MGRVEIVTLSVGVRAKKGDGEGEGRKKYSSFLPAPSPLPLTPPISSSLREFQHGAFTIKTIHGCPMKLPALQAICNHTVTLKGRLQNSVLQFTAIKIHVVVQFYPWFKFSFLLFQTHYHVIIIHYHTQKQKKRKFEPRIKLNYNIHSFYCNAQQRLKEISLV